MIRPSVLPRAGIGVLFALTVFAAGMHVGSVLLDPPVPASLSDSRQTGSVPTTTARFDDARPVDLRFDTEPDTEITTSLTGRVTATACAPGSTVVSGERILDIDGQAVIALSTAVPLWRDIAVGDEGSDVQALQNELVRLGFDVLADGRAGRITIESAASLLEDDDRAESTPVSLSRARFAWVPSPSNVTLSCDSPLASFTSPASPILTVEGALTGASIPTLPGDLVEGPRRLIVDAASVAVNPDGTVTDPSDLALLATTPSYQARDRGDPAELGVDDDDSGVSQRSRSVSSEVEGARIVLSEPIDIVTVPPTALYAVVGDEACVMSNGAPRSVTVVGSELGRTHVIVTGSDGLDTVLLTPSESPPCR